MGAGGHIRQIGDKRVDKKSLSELIKSEYLCGFEVVVYRQQVVKEKNKNENTKQIQRGKRR